MAWGILSKLVGKSQQIHSLDTAVLVYWYYILALHDSLIHRKIKPTTNKSFSVCATLSPSGKTNCCQFLNWKVFFSKCVENCCCFDGIIFLVKSGMQIIIVYYYVGIRSTLNNSWVLKWLHEKAFTISNYLFHSQICVTIWHTHS